MLALSTIIALAVLAVVADRWIARRGAVEAIPVRVRSTRAELS